MQPDVVEMDPHVFHAHHPTWWGQILVIVGALLLLAMTSFAAWTLIRNRRKGGSV